MLSSNNSSNYIETHAERLIFNCRWVLYPMTLGLIIALFDYAFKFLKEVYQIIFTSNSMDTEQLMVSLLGLIDIYMVANLLVMIAQGSYQIFIQKFAHIDPTKRPQWLDHVDSSQLKVKIATSIAGITLIRVLKIL